MQPPEITWTEPKLCHYQYDLKKEWCVFFTIRNKTTGQKKKMQFRGGGKEAINLQTTKRARITVANDLIRFWKAKLEKGWHPWQDDQTEKPVYPHTPFCDALDFAYSKVRRAKATKKAYKVTWHFVKEAAQKVGVARKRISDVTRADVKLIFEQITRDRKWSNTAYNRHIGFLGGILSQLKEWEVMPANPAHDIAPLPEAETEKYVPLTTEEKKIIRDHLSQKHFRFFVIVNIVYSTGIRPKEILALQVKDISLEREEITILPDLEAENSKTKSIRKVPIDGHLMPLLKELNLQDYPANYYVFGSPFAAGRGNQGSSKQGRGAAHPDYFKPSPVHIKRDTVTKFWNKVVIKGLGIKKYLYSLKHSGANDKILAGVDLDALRSLYGHQNKLMTLKYVTQIKEIHSKEIKEKAPGF